MIDSHCHLDAAAFDADREEVLARAWQAGLTDIVVPAVGPAGWGPLLAWARGRAGIHVALGIHPQLLSELDPAMDEQHLARLERLLAAGGVVAVGECGLDGATAARVPFARQLRVLEAHVALARRFALPVIVHCLRAHEPLLALLARAPLTAGGVLHSYSGSAAQVAAYAAHDLRFSFAGPVTYANARKPLAAARAVPRARLLIETDAPDQTPRPFRGRAEPAHLVEVARGVGAALGLDVAEVGALTAVNARALFRLAERGGAGAGGAGGAA